MKLITNAAVAVTALLVLAACGQKSKSSDDTNVYPTRVGSGEDAAAARKVGTLGEGGGVTLTLDLERPARPGEAALTTCWTMPPDELALGRAVCASDASKSVEITAANVELACGLTESRPAKAPLSMTDCTSYDIFAYAFEPAFRFYVAE